ncbi:MAG: hypothetical protein BroJett011_59650 [Chloroflexota bacterium]|nr:MAG: hypothetical protein BroJett011_59650 [Chloroflexota bacterium]
MSCDRNGSKAGATAGVAAGLSETTSKQSNVIGAFSNRVMNVIDRNGVMAHVARNPVRVALHNTFTAGLVTVGLTGVATAAATNPVAVVPLVGSALALKQWASINPDTDKGPVATLEVSRRNDWAIKGKETVNVYVDKNNANKRVFTLNQRNWGCQTYSIPGDHGQPQGAYTVLASRTVPQDYYYFKGEISSEDAVRVAAGEVKAEKLEGYAGRVSFREGLSPSWAFLKHRMIQSSLTV